MQMHSDQSGTTSSSQSTGPSTTERNAIDLAESPIHDAIDDAHFWSFRSAPDRRRRTGGMREACPSCNIAHSRCLWTIVIEGGEHDGTAVAASCGDDDDDDDAVFCIRRLFDIVVVVRGRMLYMHR
jgi:hypothetical protein